MKNRIPKISLILANLYPLFVLAGGGMTVFDLVTLYWLETAIIAIFAIPKIFMSSLTLRYPIYNSEGKIPLVVFPSTKREKKYWVSEWVGKVFVLAILFPVIAGFMYGSAQFVKDHLTSDLSKGFGTALAVLIISHGLSFVFNFIGKGEYKRVDCIHLFMALIVRICIIQSTTVILSLIIAVGIVFLINTISSMLGLVIVKILFDFGGHVLEHGIINKTQIHDNF